MIALLLSSFLNLILFASFGISFTKAFKIPATTIEKLLLGLVITNTLASYFSLGFAIDLPITCLFLFTATVMLLVIRVELKQTWVLLQTNKFVVLWAIPIILLAFVVTLRPPVFYDSALYHVQNIMWIEQYPVVPGLANLHNRLGFNPNVFTLFALTSLKDIFHQEIYSVNFSVFAILTIYFLDRLFQIFKSESISGVFLFYSAVFFIFLQMGETLSSPTPDILAFAIPVFVFLRIADFSIGHRVLEFKNYIPIIILSIYIPTTKLGALPILFLSIFILIKYKSTAVRSVWLLPILTLVILPWCIRNVILTGWILYPSSMLNIFHFDWRVPLENVIHEKDVILGWARHPGLDFLKFAHADLSEWIPVWWRTFEHKVLFLASIASPIIALFGQITKKLKIDFLTNSIIICSCFGIAFWFVFAPDFRFGQAFILIAALSPLLWIKLKWMPRFNLKFVHLVIILICYFGGLNYHRLLRLSQMPETDLLMKPYKMEIPKNLAFLEYEIIGGMIYATTSEQCFSHALPCTPYPHPTLMMRGASLGDGFRERTNTP